MFKGILCNIAGCLLLGIYIDSPAIFSKEWFVVILALLFFNTAGAYMSNNY